MTLMRRLRDRLSYANVTASLALFVALGGTSYAAVTLPRNSVGQKQLRDNAVGTKELRRGAVRSAHIRNRTIRVSDLARSTRSALAGRPGPAGPAGKDAATYRAMIDRAGARAGGNAQTIRSRPIHERLPRRVPQRRQRLHLLGDARRSPERPGPRGAARRADHGPVGRRGQRAREDLRRGR